MAVNVAKLVQTAFRTVNRALAGGTVPITYNSVTGDPVYDADTGTVTTGRTPIPVEMIPLTPGDHERTRTEADDTFSYILIAAADMPAGFRPTTEDTILWGGQTWKVVSYQEPDAGQQALWKIKVRLP